MLTRLDLSCNPSVAKAKQKAGQRCISPTAPVNYAVQATGVLRVPQAHGGKAARFELTASGSARLWLGGKLVKVSVITGGAVLYSGPLQLLASSRMRISGSSAARQLLCLPAPPAPPPVPRIADRRQWQCCTHVLIAVVPQSLLPASAD